MRVRAARYAGNDDVIAIIEEFGDLDGRLAAALGPRWAYTLLRARRGDFARF